MQISRSFVIFGINFAADKIPLASLLCILGERARCTPSAPGIDVFALVNSLAEWIAVVMTTMLHSVLAD